MTYYPVNMADCSSPFKRSVITTCHHSLSTVYNKCTGIKSVNNGILLNRLHAAMIMVLNTGSNLLFGVNR